MVIKECYQNVNNRLTEINFSIVVLGSLCG